MVKGGFRTTSPRSLAARCGEGAWESMLAALPAGACVVGVDEVGRGPLAGDVVAAAVVLSDTHTIVGLRDSKKLTALQRERLDTDVRQHSRAFAIARATPEEIDQLNILQASLLAMSRAVDALELQPDLVLVDGRHLPKWSYRAAAVVKGDDRVPAIAAASIIAKVQRDGELCRAHERWPVYGFDGHKGYPTKAHLTALQTYGPCPIHRRSFAPVRAVIAAQNEV